MAIPTTPKTTLEERNFRPKTLDDFIGQHKIKGTLGVMLNSAHIRGQPLEHLCFYGGPGLGKTTLAAIIATEMGASMREVSAPAIEKLGDLVSILVALQPRDVLFIDEIHRMKSEISETLYSAMEDFKVAIPVKSGSDSGTLPVTLPLQRFTLVGSTTDFGLLPEPLRARFGHLFPIDLYTVEELEAVILRAAAMGGILVDEPSAQIIAQRARGTPRIALRLFRRAVDLATTMGEDVIEMVTRQAMDMLQVDNRGLDEADRRYLATLAQIYNGGPVGPKSLAASSGFDEATIAQAIEPWLMRTGLVARTRLGRKLTRKGWQHIAPHIGLQIPLLDDDPPEPAESERGDLEPDDDNTDEAPA